MAPYQVGRRVPDAAGLTGSAHTADVEAGVVAALHEVSAQLDGPCVTGDRRMRLLQRQAELGDLRDELELRERRRLGARP